jgi:nucleotide-binding universal stress UspA family protein
LGSGVHAIKVAIVYQHILLPVDGSAPSNAAAEGGIAFAAQVGARVTVLHVLEQLHLYTYEFDVTEKIHDEWRHKRDAYVPELLAPAERRAREAGVLCNALQAQADEPYQAIIKTAQEQRCDLIVMGSHGRRGLQGLLLGSQTQKVLTHSSIPVLVFR